MLIVSVLGRLGGYEPVTYVIEGREIDAQIPLLALLKHYRRNCKEPVRAVLLIPESLALESEENIDEVERLIISDEKLTEKIMSEIKDKWKIVENGICATVIESVGEYARGFRVIFDSALDNIVIGIFTRVLKEIYENNVEKIVVDISTGHNIYVNALVDALRAIIVNHKLKRMFDGNKKRLEVKIAVSSPVTREFLRIRTKKAIYFSEIDVKAFFDLPYREKMSIGDIGQNKGSFYKEVSKHDDLHKSLNNLVELTKAMLDTLKLSFNAIRYNAPLALYYQDLVPISVSQREIDRAVSYTHLTLPTN